MQKLHFKLYVFLVFAIWSCQGQNASFNQVNVEEFNKIALQKDAQILDVRTPQEFNSGNIPKAKNLNWNDANFLAQTASLDKNKPVLVYCLSGGRSKKAAALLAENGFKNIYELTGGYNAYQNSSKAEIPVNKRGISKTDFLAALEKNKKTLVVFSASWCAPCIKMKPEIQSFESANSGIAIMRIDLEANKILAREFNVTTLPYLQFYEGTDLKWSDSGFFTHQQLQDKTK